MKNKFKLLIPSLLIATSATSCASFGNEIIFEDLTVGMRALIDSLASRTETHEIQHEDFYLKDEIITDKDEKILYSKTESVKYIHSFYEDSFREKKISANDEKDALDPTKPVPEITSTSTTETTILKISNLNFVYTYEKASKESPLENANYYFNLKENIELTNLEKSRSLYAASNFINAGIRIEETLNEKALTAIDEFLNQKEGKIVNTFTGFDKDETHIIFKADLSDEKTSHTYTYEFMYGNLISQEEYIKYVIPDALGGKREISEYRIVELNRDVDKFVTPNTDKFIKIELSDVSLYQYLKDFIPVQNQ